MHLLDNPTVHIEDLWVENNISKFQLNPTVDEVAMAVFPKEVCPAPAQRLASAWRRQKTGASAWTAPGGARSQRAGAWPAPGQRLRRQNTQTQHKTCFSDASLIQLQFFLLPFDPNSQISNPSIQEPEEGHQGSTPSLGE